jgi:Ca2+-binding RTX toxin-like protein
MTNISGTAGDDTLVGTSGDDLIEGLDGNDNLAGGVGNDRLEGGAGDDRMTGGAGNDLLIGGGDNDTLYDDAGGDDELEGGAGNDEIRIWRASGAAATVNRMDGGDGNDFFGVYDQSHASTFNIFAGDGNDSFWIHGAAAVAIDAGAGDDFIVLEGLSAAVSLALGGGADRVMINGFNINFGGTVTTTGFDAGDGGDSFDLDEYLNLHLAGWDGRSNPFASGYMRLVQNGADALLQVDWDGGDDNYATFITFLGTSAASLTAYNLNGWPPNGSVPVATTLVGSAFLDDNLRGGAGADLIQGLDGNDRIQGGSGDDHLEGGGGQDQINGGLGDDLIEGGEGNDFLEGDLRGADILRGGEGNDTLVGSRSAAELGWIELDGGGGNDMITTTAWQPADDLPAVFTRYRVIGGDGADNLFIYRATEAEIDAGSGDDLIHLDTYANASITLGGGSDVLELDELRGFYFGERGISVTDFEAGPTGDRIEWSAYLASALANWDRASNPFASFLRLVQSGPDTLVQISIWGNSQEFWTLVTLENVDASALGSFNMGGFPPDGSAPVGGTLLGTPDPDQLTGGAGDDTIYGLGANDVLHGGGGDDFLYGGDGTDQLVGEFGNDRLDGGADMDFLEDRSGGDDSLYGGEGRDSLYVERISGIPSTLLLDGGAEGDWLSYVGQTIQFLNVTLTMLGGEGDDEIFVNGRVTAATIDAGTGDDVVILYTDPGPYSVTLGAGSDTLELQSDRLLTGTVTVTDFQAGDGGDRLDLDGWFSSALTGWDGAQSPFATGYARLVEVGGATLLQVDRDGGGDGYVTLVTLTDVSLFNLTAVNLGGFDLVIRGTSGADQMAGTAAADLLHGGPGNDLLLLQGGGDDRAYGGEGNDILYFGAAFTGGDSADGGIGRDSVVLQGNYALTLSATNLDGVESLSLQSGANSRWGDTANNFYDYAITMNDANATGGLQLIVNAQSLRAGEDFTFDGSAETGDGKYLVYGGHGVDTLKGGAGADVFFFEGARFQAGDSVDGGAGRDALIISGGNGLTHIEFAANALTSIESISLERPFRQRPQREAFLRAGSGQRQRGAGRDPDRQRKLAGRSGADGERRWKRGPRRQPDPDRRRRCRHSEGRRRSRPPPGRSRRRHAHRRLGRRHVPLHRHRRLHRRVDGPDPRLRLGDRQAQPRPHRRRQLRGGRPGVPLDRRGRVHRQRRGSAGELRALREQRQLVRRGRRQRRRPCRSRPPADDAGGAGRAGGLPALAAAAAGPLGIFPVAQLIRLCQ